MFIALAEPNRTKSYKLELVNNKYLESFPNDIYFEEKNSAGAVERAVEI